KRTRRSPLRSEPEPRRLRCARRPPRATPQTQKTYTESIRTIDIWAILSALHAITSDRIADRVYGSRHSRFPARADTKLIRSSLGHARGEVAHVRTHVFDANHRVARLLERAFVRLLVQFGERRSE